ncbi:hypothetical protein H4O09_00650 [Stenotrophomonas sp. W1S232]|uniref:Outer membrane protein beta-barrel domain-containing protein n=1 Tax=Stenotrophomonas koreensis TaxID=266128 RepID=A0A7W3UXC9_9GAMM|nr:outer membrane beta-barrel protein [Stenotrophomonas koreensis]MBB1115575.1 hypothetical protein [Stenotrophomonas koreensis]
MRKTLILAALLAATPLAAHATENLSYTYTEAGFTRAEADMDFLGTLKGNGGYVRGAYAFTPSTHVFGSYSNLSESDGAGQIRAKYTLQQAELGLGWHMNMSERVDFTADIAYVRVKDTLKVSGIPVESGFADFNGKWEDSINAGRATLGLRGTPSARTEAWVRAGAMDGSKMDSEFVGTLGGQVKFNPTWGLVGEVQWIGDVTQYSAGVRASF